MLVLEVSLVVCSAVCMVLSRRARLRLTQRKKPKL
jgi:hypothetical protein